MGAAVFLGCVFTAFGPSFALFVFTVGADPLRVIALVAGMFFWLLSVLLSSALWFTAVQLTDQGDPKLQYLLLATGAALSVLLQELSRLTCYVLLKKAGEGLAASRRGDQRPLSPQQTAYGRGAFPVSPRGSLGAWGWSGLTCPSPCPPQCAACPSGWPAAPSPWPVCWRPAWGRACRESMETRRTSSWCRRCRPCARPSCMPAGPWCWPRPGSGAGPGRGWAWSPRTCWPAGW
nr:PREDICTED: gamma-secretase subunit APH-1A-like isoform X3 [Lepisosteus oculatus]